MFVLELSLKKKHPFILQLICNCVQRSEFCAAMQQWLNRSFWLYNRRRIKNNPAREIPAPNWFCENL